MEYAKIEPSQPETREENARLTSAELARLAAMAADDKKAKQIVMLDISSISPITDYFVVCHGSSSVQVKAIVDQITARVQEEQGGHPHHVEGYTNGRWVLLDYGDVVIHVFHEQERNFYNLERLWGDAKLVGLQEAAH